MPAAGLPPLAVGEVDVHDVLGVGAQRAAIESSSMFMWNTSAISCTLGESISRRSSFGVGERPSRWVS